MVGEWRETLWGIHCKHKMFDLGLIYLFIFWGVNLKEVCKCYSPRYDISICLYKYENMASSCLPSKSLNSLNHQVKMMLQGEELSLFSDFLSPGYPILNNLVFKKERVI